MPAIAFDRFYRYPELTQILQAMAQEHPQLVSIESIGKSFEGRDIWVLTVTNTATGPAADKPAFWIDGNIHATEVSASAANLYFLHTLVTGYGSDAEITRALVMNPRFILLDEPFAGIDPIAVTEIQKIIFHLRDRGIGILITDHNVLQTLKITDRAYIVTDGAIFRSGTPAVLAADEEVRRIYLGTDFRLD